MTAKIEIDIDIAGAILDIGGGGECVIGQIYGNKVTAIDNMQEELDEAPDCCEKRLMDATSLAFADASFDNVTFFYSLMYMSQETQIKAINEAFRVLKPGGSMFIWDTDIISAYPDPFIIDLDVVSDNISIHTTYGIIKNETQNLDTILQHIKYLGNIDLTVVKNANQFLISIIKLDKQ